MQGLADDLTAVNLRTCSVGCEPPSWMPQEARQDLIVAMRATVRDALLRRHLPSDLVEEVLSCLWCKRQR